MSTNASPTTPPSGSPFGTQAIGQTEKALGAILDRQLAGTGLTERQWVTLSVTATFGFTLTREQLLGRLAGVFKVDQAGAEELVSQLADDGLVHETVDDEQRIEATRTGAELFARVRGSITEITERLWGDLPASDLETAGRVLATVLERANAELASL
ncbi:MAG: MarR family winged helix-turn-helix transcriptional regulator [Solirubrobacteraceae bacterium]